jgi:hypothetical protein
MINTWEAIRSMVIGIAVGLVNFVVNTFVMMKDRIFLAFGSIKDFFAGVWNGITGIFTNAIDGIVSKINSLLSMVDKVKSAASSVGSFVSKGISSVGSLLPRATGGAVNPNQPYIVGERGPELFTPNGYGQITRNSQIPGGGINIVIYGDVSGEEIISKVSKGIMNQLKLNVQV